MTTVIEHTAAESPIPPPKAVSLRTRITQALLLLLLLPTSLIAWVAYDRMTQTIRADRIKTVGRVADARHEQLAMVLHRAVARAEGALTEIRLRCATAAGAAECRRRILDTVRSSENALGVALIGPKFGGEAIGDTTNDPATRFKPGQLARFSPRKPGTERSYFIIATDQASGMRLAITYSVQRIQPVFSAHPDLGNSGENFLADEEGYFITNARYPSVQGHSHPISATPMRRCLSPESSETLDLDYRDVPIIHGFRFIPEIGGGCIMAHVDQVEAFAPLTALKTQFIAFAVFFTALFAVLAGLFAQRVSLPLEKLAGVALDIAAGRRNIRTKVDGYAEVAALNAAFNAMLNELETINTGLEQGLQERTESLRESEERWKFALEGAGDGVWDWNLSTGRIDFSSRYLTMLGYPWDCGWNSLDDWKAHVNPEDMQHAMTTLEDYLDGRTPAYAVEYRMSCADGSWKWILSRGMVVRHTDDGRPLRMIGTHADITERKQAEERMQHLANHDALTGLPNRLNLQERVGQATRLAKRNGTRLALLLIDLDRFKAINDTLGHDVGDRLLIEVAQRLIAAVRESDIVARLGGDEFVVIITEMNAIDDASRVAEKIVESISRPYLIAGQALNTSPSIGIGIYPDDATEFGDLLKNADVAMYRAKSAGRGNFKFFGGEAA